MNNQLEIYNLITNLSSSETFGDQYDKVFEDLGSSFKIPMHKDLEEMYNSIIGGNYTLSTFQEGVLIKIFNELTTIEHQIDPLRLKGFDHFMNEDNELVLWRKDNEKLINFIIHDSEDIALSFIGDKENTNLTFFTIESDFEGIVLRFLI